MAFKQQRPDPNKSLVGFVVGEISYAVPISAVREIVNPVPLTELPHAPRVIAGVADHRGEIVPIVDLRARFGLSPLSDARRVKWILIDVEGRGIGLMVDKVTDVFGTGGAEIKAAPTLGGGEESRGIAGVTNRDGELIFVLDVDRFDTLVDPAVMSRLSEPVEDGR